MKKVITYGTYDLLHYGHIRLLQRAKELGDYLIVGVTADDFDKVRGKINVSQSLMERIEAVKATGLADEIIVEEYEGQKIDDIKRLDIDIFTVGSDWEGYFDYLKEYCDVVYLDRTKGISSSNLRSEKRELKLGIVGDTSLVEKIAKESEAVNGISLIGIYSKLNRKFDLSSDLIYTSSLEELLNLVDAVYILSHPTDHFDHIKKSIQNKKHVICESPIALTREECSLLFDLAKENDCVLFDGIKTAYSTAFSRLLLLIKSGKIGKVVSIDSTCTSLKNSIVDHNEINPMFWNSICAWGPTALLPVLQILGGDYKMKFIVSHLSPLDSKFDLFTKINLVYDDAIATISVGKGVKSEGDLVVSGTKGYAYVPAPWWKTDYFELRYENQENNRRFFYQLDGEGIRYQLVAFVKTIQTGKDFSYISQETSKKISEIIEYLESKDDVIYI